MTDKPKSRDRFWPMVGAEGCLLKLYYQIRCKICKIKAQLCSQVLEKWKVSLSPTSFEWISDCRGSSEFAPYIFLNFAKSFIMAWWLHCRNKNYGSPTSFLRYEQLKLKYGIFRKGFPVAMVTFYFTKTTKSFSAKIGVLYRTKTLLLNDTVLWCQLLKLVWATLKRFMVIVHSL
mgnify:CR=1 FL=1